VNVTTDPVAIEVVRNKLDDVADEMEIALLRTSHSSSVKEALDASAAIFDASGQQVAQATAAPIHLGMIIPAVQKFLDVFPVESMQDGDAYILNDPFDGGTHLPDLVISVPVVVEGHVIALATTISHHQEIGGRSYGSNPMDATDIFQEGLRLPALKLYDAGRKNDTLFEIISRNVRIPEVVIGDIYGQLAACHVAKARLVEMVADYGQGTLESMMKILLDRAEAMARDAISAMPDGIYHFTDYLDDDGVDRGKLVKVETTLTVRGDEITVDLTGSDPQVRGPINCVPASTLAAIYYVLKVAIGPEIPNNAGCYRPLRVVLPEASVVNAAPPSAVNARAVVVRRLVDCLLGALVQALPSIVPAASGGHPLALYMGGIDPRTNRPYVTMEVGTGGMGARPSKDGVDVIQTDTSNSQNVPVEALEIDFPLRVDYYRIRPDSGGPGLHRGGMGFEKRIRVLRGELHVSHRGERTATAPWGLFGGQPGAMCKSIVTRKNGKTWAVPSKIDFTLEAGEYIDVWTTGGGGYGDPLTRDPARVLNDVAEGKVSGVAAQEDYGVVIRDGAVEAELTAARRASLIASRGAIDWVYDRGALGRE
jgi:N-methylhydantoinase B